MYVCVEIPHQKNLDPGVAKSSANRPPRTRIADTALDVVLGLPSSSRGDFFSGDQSETRTALVGITVCNEPEFWGHGIEYGTPTFETTVSGEPGIGPTELNWSSSVVQFLSPDELGSSNSLEPSETCPVSGDSFPIFPSENELCRKLGHVR